MSNVTTVTTVIFLSRHNADSSMLNQLKDKLGEIELIQYKGTFSEFQGGKDGVITFTEVVEEGEPKEKVTYKRCIPAASVIVGVMPPQLQINVLNAINAAGGEAILLQPLTNRVRDKDVTVTFEFVGLNQIHKVEVITSTFSGGELAPAHERR